MKTVIHLTVTDGGYIGWWKDGERHRDLDRPAALAPCREAISWYQNGCHQAYKDPGRPRVNRLTDIKDDNLELFLLRDSKK